MKQKLLDAANQEPAGSQARAVYLEVAAELDKPMALIDWTVILKILPYLTTLFGVPPPVVQVLIWIVPIIIAWLNKTPVPTPPNPVPNPSPTPTPAPTPI